MAVLNPYNRLRWTINSPGKKHHLIVDILQAPVAQYNEELLQQHSFRKLQAWLPCYLQHGCSKENTI